MIQKISNQKLDFMNLVIHEDLVIEFYDENFVYIKLQDFIEIKMVDEKYFCPEEYNLQPNPDICGVYESEIDKQYKTLLIIGYNDILIIKAYHYEINKEFEREKSSKVYKFSKHKNQMNLSNININEVRIGCFPENQLMFELRFSEKEEKFSYISKNYFEAFKIVRKTKDIESKDFIDYLAERSFLAKHALECGISHHVLLDTIDMTIEIIFTGYDLDMQLYKLE